MIGTDGIDQAINALSGNMVTPMIGTNLVEIDKANLAANSQYICKSSC